MKKYLILLVSMFTIGALFSGCKKEEKTESEPPAAEATPTPASDAPVSDEDEGDLVNMRESSSEDETNVIGEKSAAAVRTELVNQTGAEIAGIYVRPHDSSFEDEEWGAELIQGKFTLKNGEKAVYYFKKGSGDEEGLYDLRISYVDESRSEYYYRMIPLDNVSSLSFCVDDEEGSVIPYARYMNSVGSAREVSTLDEVKKRLGYYDDESDEDEDSGAEPTPTPEENPNDASEPTPTPSNPYEDLPNQSEDPAAEAENYIGRPLEELVGALGEPNGYDYQDEPETGETGYHYYDTFTVSTTVDSDGNEVVAGVW